jgi:5-methylthioribose kinase
LTPPCLLDAADRGGVERYLVSQGLAPAGTLPIAIARAGAGNMNLTLRVTAADGHTLILKQGRPWVEKYAQIPAPIERTLVEAAFYRAVAPHPLVASQMPRVLHVDAGNHVLVLEDIGTGGDWTSIYDGDDLPAAALAALLEWLDALGRVTMARTERSTFENRAMRALNHEHIFDFPLRASNGLDLDAITPGLGGAAQMLIADRAYVEIVTALGHRYLADGPALVHGDYFPGSWLRASGAIRVIDPEFCFVGDAEFDYGVLAAHLLLATAVEADPVSLQAVFASAAARGLDSSLVAQYSGVEIMRRLIGVAQLPLPHGIDRKRALLDASRRLVVEPRGSL